MRALAAFVMKGRAQAVAVVAGAAGLAVPLPLFSLFSTAALALVTLRRGLLEGGMVLVMAMAFLGGLGMVTAVGGTIALGFGLTLWLPVLLAAFVLRESGSLWLTLEAVFGLGFLAVLGVYLFNEDVAGMWGAWLQVLLQPMIEHASADFDPRPVKDNIAFISHFITGIAAAFAVGGLVLGLLLGRWWQAQLFNPGGFRAEFVALRLPSWLAYLGLMSLAVALWQENLMGELAWNLNVLFFLLFLIGGLAVLHAVFADGGSRRFILTGIYIGLFFIPHMLLPVALLGFSDVWLDWRRRQSMR